MQLFLVPFSIRCPRRWIPEVFFKLEISAGRGVATCSRCSAGLAFLFDDREFAASEAKVTSNEFVGFCGFVSYYATFLVRLKRRLKHQIINILYAFTLRV